MTSRLDLGGPKPIDVGGQASSGDTGAEPAVVVEGVAKSFRGRRRTAVDALHDVSLTVRRGEIVVLLGPSGCGKTTLLRTIAGLELPDRGNVSILGRKVFAGEQGLDVPTERRRLGMMFQSYALWPNMTAARNVAYPLVCQRLPKRDIAEEVANALRMVGIPELGDRYPGEMSGGQQQRVALARAVVGHREVVLFDEPLSNVDAKVRQEVRFELLAVQRRLRFTAIYVTHDQHEALSMADRLAVMQSGRLVQLGTPEEVYTNPRTRYVANFLGPVNELPGTVRAVEGGDRTLADTPAGVIAGSNIAGGAGVGDEVTAVVRPHHCRLHRDEPAGPNRWHARVVSSSFVGHRTEYMVALDGRDEGRAKLPMFEVWGDSEDAFPPQSGVWLSAPAERVLILRA